LFFFFSALESPTMRGSPSLYEGAFRLETTARPSDMFTAGAMLLATPPSSKQQEDDSIVDDDDDSLSSPPIDESYKIRIGPTIERHRAGSLSPPPRSHEGEEEEEDEDQKLRRRHGDEVQDLSVTSGTAQRMATAACGEEAMEEEEAGRRMHGHGDLRGYHSEESNH
jgi:hypothetical protein